MAYYWPDSSGFDPNEGGKNWKNALHVYLDGGTGGASATVEGLSIDTWVDITAIYGITSVSAAAGSTEQKILIDGKHELNSFVRVRLNITADDVSHYSVRLIRT